MTFPLITTLALAALVARRVARACRPAAAPGRTRILWLTGVPTDRQATIVIPREMLS